MEAIVKARGLIKRYGELVAVAGVDFEIRKGECFGLLGPNGAGKTSTVGMLCCVLPITEGDITLFGLSAKADPRRIKARIGVCPQDSNLDTDFSVLQNLTIYARYFDIPAEIAKRRALALIERFHLGEKTDVCVEDLSGGLKRRTLIARALINEPDLVVLDEPTTGLDPQSRHQIWEEIRRIKGAGGTVLLTTHNMEEAALLCDRLVIIDGGRIIETGAPGDLILRHLGGQGTLEDVFLKLTGRHLRE